jgi:hypothetical protein
MDSTMTRVKKARRNAIASGCGHWVLVGERIVRRDGKWMCLPCALAAIRGAA